MKILNVIGSQTNTLKSASSSLSYVFIKKLLKRYPGKITIENLVLFNHPYSDHILPDDFSSGIHLPIVKQFKKFDTFIFSFGMINFTIPSILKSYIDKVIVQTETFNYQPDGSVLGYFKSKPACAFIFNARGGYYEGTSSGTAIHDSNLLEVCLRFIGFEHIFKISLEGTQIKDESGNFVNTLDKLINDNQQKLDELVEVLSNYHPEIK